MLNANDLRVNRTRRQEMERTARQQNAARAADRPQRRQTRSTWARVAALFV